MAIVAMGSNAAFSHARPLQIVRAGLAAIAARWGDVKVSAFYQTPAFPAGSGPDFINAVCAFETSDGPEQVLAALHDIEAEAGRERLERWGARTLDLDLLAHGSRVSPNEAVFDRWRRLPLNLQIKTAPDELILPHPRLQDRAFVLVPMADVAPDWVHPVLGKSVQALLADCSPQDVAEVVLLDP